MGIIIFHGFHGQKKGVYIHAIHILSHVPKKISIFQTCEFSAPLEPSWRCPTDDFKIIQLRSLILVIRTWLSWGEMMWSITLSITHSTLVELYKDTCLYHITWFDIVDIYITLLYDIICTISGSLMESCRTLDVRWTSHQSHHFGEVSWSFCNSKVQTKSDNKIGKTKETKKYQRYRRSYESFDRKVTFPHWWKKHPGII